MALSGKRFPVLLSPTEKRVNPECPKSVAWEWLAPHEGQAQRNHGGQTLARLAERGGLSPLEMVCVLQDREFALVSDYTAANREAAQYLMALCTDEDMAPPLP